MAKPTRECRMISDGGLLTPCKNCGRYHGMDEGYKPKTELDFSQESPRLRRLRLEIINKNLPIIEQGIVEAKSEDESRRWARAHRKCLKIKKALEEVSD